MENKANLMQVINNSSPSQLVSHPMVMDRFKSLYQTIHGIQDSNAANSFFEAEKFHFLKLINDNPNIKACTPLSLYGIFMDVAVSGLSFDPTMKHLYVVPYNTNVGTKDQPKWEKRAALQISGYGELLLRQLQGQIKYADNPVLVYEGDEFRFGSKDGKTVLDHIACIPRKSSNIIAAYIKITRYDDTHDFKVMSMEDIQALRKFSKDQNSKAWTDGLPGMIAAKVIKHAFKNYPKVRIGKNTNLASEIVDQEVEEFIDYGIDIDPPHIAEVQDQITEPQTQNTLPHSNAEALDF